MTIPVQAPEHFAAAGALLEATCPRRCENKAMFGPMNAARPTIQIDLMRYCGNFMIFSEITRDLGFLTFTRELKKVCIRVVGRISPRQKVPNSTLTRKGLSLLEQKREGPVDQPGLHV